MDKLFDYVEENKESMRDQDYKQILDCIMKEKAIQEKLRINDKTSLSKLFSITNDFIRLSKAYLNLNLEREGVCYDYTLPSINVDMDYQEFQERYHTGEINPLL